MPSAKLMNMTTPRPSVSREGLTNQIIASFKDLLGRGILHWGTKLPPEREMALKFGVSRVSLRHALKALELFGVITQRVGDGTYLSPDPSKILGPALDFLLLVDDISPLDVIDTRLIVEPELAAAAARNARAENITQIGSILERMRVTRDEMAMNELDLAFHEAIFHASGNRLTTRIFSILHRSMLDSMEVTSKLVDSKHTIAFHEPIYIAIRDRKEEEARLQMRRHLTDAQQILERAITKKPANDLSAFPSFSLKARN